MSEGKSRKIEERLPSGARKTTVLEDPPESDMVDTVDEQKIMRM